MALSGPSPARAQTAPGESLTVSPPTLELEGGPGQLITEKVAIDNGSNTARTVSVSVQNFTAQGETGGSELTEEDGKYGMSKWVRVSPQRVTIRGGERREFDLQINIPTNPPPGGHFGAVIFEPITPGDGANVQVVPRVTALVLLKTPGQVEERLSVASFHASKDGAPNDAQGVPKASKFFQRGPVNYQVRVQNDGNVHLKPQVEVEIRNIFGRKVETLRLDARNVLPESIRRFDTKWDQKHLFGLYKAKTVVRWGTPAEPKTVSETNSFWAAPIWALPIIAIVLLILIIGLVIGVLARKRLGVALKAFRSGGVPPAPVPAPAPVAEKEQAFPAPEPRRSRRFAEESDLSTPSWEEPPAPQAPPAGRRMQPPPAPEPPARPTPPPAPKREETYGDPPRPNRRFADEGPPEGEDDRRGRRFK